MRSLKISTLNFGHDCNVRGYIGRSYKRIYGHSETFLRLFKILNEHNYSCSKVKFIRNQENEKNEKQILHGFTEARKKLI